MTTAFWSLLRFGGSLVAHYRLAFCCYCSIIEDDTNHDRFELQPSQEMEKIHLSLRSDNNLITFAIWHSEGQAPHPRTPLEPRKNRGTKCQQSTPHSKHAMNHSENEVDPIFATAPPAPHHVARLPQQQQTQPQQLPGNSSAAGTVQ
jgi:hypothetical protein